MNYIETSQLYIVLMLAKIAVMFVVIYFVSPSLIPEFYQKEDRFLDKFYISFIHSNLTIIVLAHFLVFIKMYEIFTLLCFSGGIYFLVYRFIGFSPAEKIEKIKTRWISRAYDYVDGYISNESIKNSVRIRFRTRYEGLQAAFLKSLQNPLVFWLPLLVMAAAGYIRLKYGLTHAAYSTSDSYVHLVWVKYMLVNDIYHDGVYPEGFHAIIASMTRLTFIDGYWLIRFMGPLAALLLILTVYYFCLRVTGSSSAALISMAVYGIILDLQFPSLVERQTAALPQEYAAIFILPGLYFLLRYIREQKVYHLLLYAEALAITGLIHSYAALYMTIWASVILITGICLKYFALRPFLKSVGFSVGAGVVSFIPLGIGLLSGHGFYKGATDFIATSNTFDKGLGSSGTLDLANLLGNNPFFVAALASAALLIFSSVLRRQRHWALTSIPISLSAIIMLIFYQAGRLGIPQMTHPSRTGVFMTIVFAVLYGLAFYSLEAVIAVLFGYPGQLRQRVIQGAAVAICLLIAFKFTGYRWTLTFQEYDAAAEAYIAIQESYPNMGWTIVGPQEQYQQVLSHGWHYDLIKFVRDFSIEQANNPKFDLPIPTRDIFIFTEKRPMHSAVSVTPADGAKELAPPGPDPYAEYYVAPEQRRILEAKALNFMETYMRTHSGVRVFYEDANIKIFHVEHQPIQRTEVK